jgi:predicted amidohydrolase YtcJ
VVLSDDIFSIPAAKIKDVKVLTTIAGGRIVYQR